MVMQAMQAIQDRSVEQQQTIEQNQSRINELEKAVAAQETNLAAMNATLEAMQKTSVNRSAPASSAPSTRRLERKINRIESAIETAKQTTPATPVENPNAEKDAYTAAYLALKSGRYGESSIAFKMFLSKYPTGEYTDQAYYWLGESQYAKHELDAAISAFSKVANDFPDSSKHEAALLKLANAYQELSRRGDAKAILQRLIHDHPNTNAAEQARNMLDQLATQGQ